MSGKKVFPFVSFIISIPFLKLLSLSHHHFPRSTSRSSSSNNQSRATQHRILMKHSCDNSSNDGEEGVSFMMFSSRFGQFFFCASWPNQIACTRHYTTFHLLQSAEIGEAQVWPARRLHLRLSVSKRPCLWLFSLVCQSIIGSKMDASEQSDGSLLLFALSCNQEPSISWI